MATTASKTFKKRSAKANMINVILLIVIMMNAVRQNVEWCNTECHNAVRSYTGVILTYNTLLFPWRCCKISGSQCPCQIFSSFYNMPCVIFYSAVLKPAPTIRLGRKNIRKTSTSLVIPTPVTKIILADINTFMNTTKLSPVVMEVWPFCHFLTAGVSSRIWTLGLRIVSRVLCHSATRSLPLNGRDSLSVICVVQSSSVL